MHKTFLFIRKTGIGGTKILETSIPEAIQFIRANKKNIELQIGILGGKDYETVKSVYGEYAPFEKIHSFSEI